MSYATIEAWARLTRRELSPDEVHAIIALDAAMLAPGDPETEVTS